MTDPSLIFRAASARGWRKSQVRLVCHRETATDSADRARTSWTFAGSASSLVFRHRCRARPSPILS